MRTKQVYLGSEKEKTGHRCHYERSEKYMSEWNAYSGVSCVRGQLVFRTFCVSKGGSISKLCGCCKCMFRDTVFPINQPWVPARIV